MPLKIFELYLGKIKKYKQRIGKVNSVNINKNEDRSFGNELVKEWFSQIRPNILAYTGLEDHIKSVDALLQELLSLTLDRKPKKRYQQILRSLFSILHTKILPILISKPAQVIPIVSGIDEKLYITLSRFNEGIANSYKQILIDLQDQNRISFKGTANEIREVLREVLEYLAPDDIVSNQSGFKLEESRDKPTMKQKVRHILSSRGYKSSQTDLSLKAIETIEEKIAALARLLYSRSSLSTHVSTQRAEIVNLKNYVSVVLCELLEVS